MTAKLGHISWKSTCMAFVCDFIKYSGLRQDFSFCLTFLNKPNQFCRCSRQTYSTAPNCTRDMFRRTKILAKLYPGYSLTHENHSPTIPHYSLAMIFICQIIQPVQFGYNFHMPKHTPSIVWLRFSYAKPYRGRIIFHVHFGCYTESDHCAIVL